ncbi:MAG: PQQ-dependent sugar dehydrogenase [Wenzhouxiangellaceae bacterium]|nr:PQQ-dependent sugar dehydrogenase [Wenzhouxiangellaceae bacterium]
MRNILLLIGVLMLVACNGAQQPEDQSSAPAESDAGAPAEAASETKSKTESNAIGASNTQRAPEETREPNAEWQTPAFPGQTRAPQPAETEDWTVETVAEGLDHPWALEFLPDGSMLVTERPGHLRHVSATGEISEPIAGVPEVHAEAQGGLLDVALAPDFEQSRRIYLTYAEPTEAASRTAAATGILSESNDRLNDIEVIFRQRPEWESRGHYGSRIVFAEDGTLFITLGDRMDRTRVEAQDPSNHLGTVVRLNPDGSVPEDNPFVDDEQGAPEVWSWGHRNIQAADLHPETGQLWTIEHGPKGGDELNHPEPGRNYGWPEVTYGENYDGTRVVDGVTQRDDVEQPVYYWDPVIAPSGMDFYTGERFENWTGDLFVGGLASAQVTRLVMDEGRVVAEQWLEIGERVRDVKQGPDGAIYLVTDHDNGKLMRIVPDGN